MFLIGNGGGQINSHSSSSSQIKVNRPGPAPAHDLGPCGFLKFQENVKNGPMNKCILVIEWILGDV